MIRVLLAEDNALVRSGYRMILHAEPDIRVAAETGDGREALALARSERPDVCLVDIRMPGMDGIELTRRIAGPDAAHPLPVVIITTFDHDEYLFGALRAGAVGFLLKEGGPRLLAPAIRAAATGEGMVSPSVTLRLLDRLRASRAGAAKRPHQPMTPRELDVVRMVARGHTNTEIAAALHLAPSTVKTHLTNAQLKIDARNRVEVAGWAWSSGLVS